MALLQGEQKGEEIEKNAFKNHGEIMQLSRHAPSHFLLPFPPNPPIGVFQVLTPVLFHLPTSKRPLLSFHQVLMQAEEVLVGSIHQDVKKKKKKCERFLPYAIYYPVCDTMIVNMWKYGVCACTF